MTGRTQPYQFCVDVIVPVFNAETTVKRAVESAIALPQVRNVILVEDGSSDGSLLVCKGIRSEFERVQLLRHGDLGNHGAGAARNLGVTNAQADFIAFLDADDWYLPNRFEADSRLFECDPSLDGAYSALGNHYENPSLRKQWLDQGWPDTMTFSSAASPAELFSVLMWTHPSIHGDFHLDTLTLRRTLFDRIGGFHTGLRLQQDTHLARRLAAVGRLAGASLSSPVAIRRVHGANRMTHLEDHEQYYELWWESLGDSLAQLNVSHDVMRTYRRAYAHYRSTQPHKWKALGALGRWVIMDLREVTRPYGPFDLTFRRLFSEGQLATRFLSAKNRVVREIRRSVH
jgi:hypothetical protein